MLWPLYAFIGINAILFNPYNIPLFSFTRKKSKANRGEVSGLCFRDEQCKHLATRHSSTAPLHSAANVAVWEVGLKKRSIGRANCLEKQEDPKWWSLTTVIG